MKPKLLLLLFLLMSLGSYAEGKRFAFTADTAKLHKTKTKHIKKLQPIVFRVVHSRESVKGYKPWYDDCVFTNQYTIAQRLKKYPFSKAVKILAVSFNGDAEPNSPIVIGELKSDTRSYAEKQLLKGLTIIKDSLDYSTLYEVKTLNQDQINHLTNIIYNTAYKKILPNTTDLGYACYAPRNAFIFLNKYGKVIDYLEICFECRKFESKYGKLSIGDYCNPKFDMLRKCFADAGIKNMELQNDGMNNMT
ncbi:hypothetical protein G7092_09420 [Mucilaginibacter sp. HC2]|uniref:hypothetical protein n=1 Tax=Mucilaginibacter inviolabilis TaxID=2714892 RepID=UPI0014077D9A|nr:hypothetical protein [Mucilaginibacter inviolabilis]NHA04015.1 hypothetical protein [Mucilaginibacter inviolabilis]